MALPKLVYSIYESSLRRKLNQELLPQHLGLIHDGHRRFAREKGLLSYEVSYRIGMKRFKDCISWCEEFNINYVTSWLLSKENLQRDAEELKPYFKVLGELFEDLSIEDTFDNYSIKFIGSLEELPYDLKKKVDMLETVRSSGEKKLTIALGYGGRQEILDAVKSLIKEKYEISNSLDEAANHITDTDITKHLYSPNLPDIDLIIRTSGEARLSGFLLWQSAYSEFVFEDVYWPAFRKIDFLRCLREYARRERRFGK
jgi:short-chain Z-isoprenyl diphosphate synthase